ncbi:MAG: hypothetical protein WKF85_01680 [Chitinophagaceae bacterium]
MKDKKYKNVEDIIENYLILEDEEIEIPLLITKAKEKFESLKLVQGEGILKPSEAEDAFKVFMQLKKHKDRKIELRAELAEAENLLKEFLRFVNENKISYEKKDDNKNKITYLFWLEDGKVKCNR